MLTVPVVILLAAAAILAGVVIVALGRGGEMASFSADHAPLDLGSLAATDVVLLRPPTSIWGYNIQVTDDALSGIARAMSERDTEIAVLRQQLADLRAAAPQTYPAAASRSESALPSGFADPPAGWEPAPESPPTTALRDVFTPRESRRSFDSEAMSVWPQEFGQPAADAPGDDLLPPTEGASSSTGAPSSSRSAASSSSSASDEEESW